MVFPTDHRTEDPFHLEFEEEGGEARDGNIGGDGESVDLLIIVGGKHVDDLLFICRQGGEELSLDALLLCLLQLGVFLPSHGIYKVLCTGNQRGGLLSYQSVTPFRVFRPYSPREGEGVAVVVT